jgi:hypothetical protein
MIDLLSYLSGIPHAPLVWQDERRLSTGIVRVSGEGQSCCARMDGNRGGAKIQGKRQGLSLVICLKHLGES